MIDKATVHVNLSERSYDIEIGSGNLVDAGPFVCGLAKLTHAVLITDTNVEEPHGNKCAESLAESGADVDLVVVEAGEASKSVDMANQLWQQILEHGADRKSVVVAAGGGVVGDLAGFIAATFGRGVSFVQVPTTLLAQVDSSVGGKVGVNLPGAKNMVGAFWQPLGVLIDTDVLNTLPIREYRSGLAEVVKYGVILDADFFDYLEQHIDGLNERHPDVLRHVIACSCRLKADVVENDEREVTGLRAVLNYGHTFAHAIEAETGYGHYLHGEAVSIGMLCASRLAERLGRVDSELTRRQHELLAALGLPVDVPDMDREVLLDAMQRDKKVAHGRLRFVLPTRMGHVELVSDVPEGDVRAAWG
ncbi:MAG: 3-dehydroquinate synthase [Planctomycetes bacterium]|nr:3-dehydroquinate synthase [Planctomycetota bacterium]MBL7037726.1 3-dehydroquinate synthase [Pirellulaceae bacterium]